MADYSPDLKKLLMALRRELNHLNTLNCVVHQFQGDFEADFAKARKQTDGATNLYLEHLQGKVEPLFAELGKRLATDGLVDDNRDAASAAREWYRATFLTGELW